MCTKKYTKTYFMIKKKKERKKVLLNTFDSDFLDKKNIDELFSILKQLKHKLEFYIEKNDLENKIKNIDNLYSITVQETERNIRLLATILEIKDDEEIEKKISLVTLSLTDKVTAKYIDIINLKRVFYSYRHLLITLEFLNPDLIE